MTVSILNWNILQGGGKRMEAISSTIESLKPDIVVLQEFRRNKSAPILEHMLDATGLVNRYHASESAKANSVLIATHLAMQIGPWTNTLSAQHAANALIERTGKPPLSILAAHFPHKKKQIPFFEALLDHDVTCSEHAILLGDLNCGIPFEDSETKTFENTHLFQALLSNDWVDSWRSRNPDKREYSWVSTRGNGYRYDHCLATAALDVTIARIDYLHEPRNEGLSDHSPLLITIE